jgi:hypothetical protein
MGYRGRKKLHRENILGKRSNKVYVFLAHSSADKKFALKLANHLKTFGIHAWVYESELRIGDSLVERIQQTLKQVDLLIVLLSPHSVRSRWVQKELEPMLVEEIETGKVKVIPVLYKKCKLPPFLKGKLYADLSTPAKYEKNLGRLVQSILSLASARRLPSLATVDTEQPDEHFADKIVQQLLPKNAAHEEEWIKSRIWLYVLEKVAQKKILLSDTWWESETTMFIDCEVPAPFTGFQDMDCVVGIQVEGWKAVRLFAVTTDGSLALSPTGRAVLKRLRTLVRRSRYANLAHF